MATKKPKLYLTSYLIFVMSYFLLGKGFDPAFKLLSGILAKIPLISFAGKITLLNLPYTHEYSLVKLAVTSFVSFFIAIWISHNSFQALSSRNDSNT